MPDGSRAIYEIAGERAKFIDELVAMADRAQWLEGDKANIVTAVRRLALAEGRDETYNEGLNAAATILAWLYEIRPTGHTDIHDSGLREIRQACRAA